VPPRDHARREEVQLRPDALSRNRMIPESRFEENAVTPRSDQRPMTGPASCANSRRSSELERHHDSRDDADPEAHGEDVRQNR